MSHKSLICNSAIERLTAHLIKCAEIKNPFLQAKAVTDGILFFEQVYDAAHQNGTDCGFIKGYEEGLKKWEESK